MNLQSHETAIDGVLLIDPPIFADPRGHFFESWHREKYANLGVHAPFVQDNVSSSVKDTLRGLHIQHPFGQGKLLQVLHGEIYDVVVDLRIGSPTFGRWIGAELSSANHRQVFVPPGLAHGFCVMSDVAIVGYKCTELYHPEAEFTLVWDDPAVGVRWPIQHPLLSKKDAAGFTLKALEDRGALPSWESK